MHRTNLISLLMSHDIDATDHRLQVLELLATAQSPLSAHGMLNTLAQGEERPMNKVTLYRILDLFVQKGVLERHHDGDKSWRYCMPSATGTHCHFYCRSCGRMECVRWTPPMDQVEKTLEARVEQVDIRFDGVCATCAKQMSDG